MAKIGGGGSTNLGKSQQEEGSPWQKLSLALVDGNADSWFEDYGLISLEDQYSSEPTYHAEGARLLSHAARANLNIIPQFEVVDGTQGELESIPDTKLGQAIVGYLEAKGVAMEYKTLWPISHEAQVELDVKHRLDGQWGTEKSTPFIQSLEIYKDSNGKTTAYWFVDLLASPVPLESFNSFEVIGDDGEVATYSFPPEQDGWTVGKLSTKLQIPVLIKQLAYLSESPFPSTQIMSFSRNMAFADVPNEARPIPFFCLRKNGLVQGYSKTLSKGLAGRGIRYDGSLFPDAIQFGWRFDEESIPHLAKIMPVIVDGCTYAMSTVEDGFENYRDRDYPAPWDDVVGSPCNNMVDYESRGSRLAAPQWVPNTHIGEITTQTQDVYSEAAAFISSGNTHDALERLNTLANDGAGPFLIHGINTLIYSFLLPKLKEEPESISNVRYLARQNIGQGMLDQSTNSMSNLGIAYYLVGDLERSEETLLEALEQKDKYAESEASYFLSLVYSAQGQDDLASHYKARSDAAGGYEPPEWLMGKQASGMNSDSKLTKSVPHQSAFCSSCGFKFTSEEQKFCPNCGNPR